MPNCIPETKHFVVPMVRESKTEINLRVATAFCEAAQQFLKVVVTVEDVNRESPDTIINVGGRMIGLELTAYHQRDEYHQLQKLEADLRTRVARELADSGLPPYQVRIHWIEEVRRNRNKGMSRDVACVPRGKDQDAFVKDFLHLARFVCANGHFGGQSITFRDTRVVTAIRLHSPTNTVLDKADYPVLARFCSTVELTEWTHAGPPLIHSSFDCRWVGPDYDQIESIVRSHLSQIESYRSNTRLPDIWLLIHADGIPSSTWVDGSKRGDMFEVIRRVSSERADGFAAIWWAENTRFQDATNIWPVM